MIFHRDLLQSFLSRHSNSVIFSAMPDQQIILVAHGSRAPAANEEIRQLAATLTTKGHKAVSFAFLDSVAQPNIPEVIDTLMKSHPKRILIVPYFLNSGNHVNTDIPKIIAQKQQEYPDVSFVTTAHLGASSKVIEILIDLLS
jgi:sirohydrochlorin ferrochelatase